MTTTRLSFAVLMLVAFVPLAGADVRQSAPDAGADVVHQQDTVKLGEEEESEEEESEEEESEEDEEPDCE